MIAREVVLKALYSIETGGTYTNFALKEALKCGDLSSRDKGFVTELIYGVVSNKSAIDYIISQFSKVKLKKMTPWVLNILRMGVYQIYYMNKIPHSAACNEAVKLAKKYSHGAGSGFVNGVLRNVSRSINEISFPDTGDAAKDLSLEFSYPEWITKRIIDEYGATKCRELYEENRKAHGVAIRINTLKTTPDEIKEIFEKQGILYELVPELNNALILKGGLSVETSDEYREGLFSLQNISSQKAAFVLDPRPGDFVIDMCAAPGGKSCAMAEQMMNKGKIVSCDIFDHKLELIQKSANRLGIDIIDARHQDSTKRQEAFLGKADRVLADVPCSGIGVIHKKPDIKWNRKEEDIEELCKIQEEILEVASGYVKNGGVLVYSTCTILPEENKGRIEKFLLKHTEFTKVFEEQILTGVLGESGFYICKMLKG